MLNRLGFASKQGEALPLLNVYDQASVDDAAGGTAGAARVMARCDELAAISTEPDRLTRLYLFCQHRRQSPGRE